ncbi:MAG: LysR substrate-binding domain-containing protein [Acidiphilium sp.]
MLGINMANGWQLALPALAVFEAAARHGNFSRAARELGTTQPAVSHQIGWLEARLSCKLFRRLHRGVGLTAEGELLFAAASASRSAIERAQDEIRARGGRRPLGIATDYGFAGEWLIPRLADLAVAAPEIEVRITASHSPVDPGAEPADVAILLGDGAWTGREATLLFPETVSAVSAPSLFAGAPVSDLADLAGRRLLHLETPMRTPWLTWQGWFAAQGIARRPREGDFFFNTYSLVQQAAIAGQGFALGWHPLIDGAVAAGRLCRVLPARVETRMGYYLVEDADHPAPPALELFRDWLFSVTRASVGPTSSTG